MQRVVGILELASKYRYGLTGHGVPLYLFRPYDEALPEFIVGSKSNDKSYNQIALVDIPVDATSSPAGQTKPRGSLVRMLGPVGNQIAEREALLQHYCPTRQKTVEIPEVSQHDDAGRLELSEETGWVIFHIDPPGCRDIDDAVAWSAETGKWAIIIADASTFVPIDSDIDRVAAAIGSTFYDCYGRVVVPMLPPAISEDRASLLPGTRRRGIALIWGPNHPEKFLSVWCTVKHSFTYDSFVGSAIAFSLDISQDPHDWIADLMIRYNTAAARLLKTVGLGILRSQSSTDAEKVASWPIALRHLAAEAATYTLTTGGGHASLGLDAYTHASSPLRRYVDLYNQRIIKAFIRGDTVVSTEPIDHLNARASANKRWARDLTFLTYVTPGKVHEIDVIWVSESRVWVPVWSRLVHLRHEEPRAPGMVGRIKIFCDVSRRNWKRRILTATI